MYLIPSFSIRITGDDLIPGNMGLLDQREAMKWVQANIEGISFQLFTEVKLTIKSRHIFKLKLKQYRLFWKVNSYPI